MEELNVYIPESQSTCTFYVYSIVCTLYMCSRQSHWYIVRKTGEERRLEIRMTASRAQPKNIERIVIFQISNTKYKKDSTSTQHNTQSNITAQELKK